MTIEEAKEFIAQSVKSDIDMAKVADAIKTLEQEPRWIPVSERLPKDNETVIASIEHGYVYPETRYSKEYGWEFPWVYLEGKVEAWMPLPKPYKAESEDKE